MRAPKRREAAKGTPKRRESAKKERKIAKAAKTAKAAKKERKPARSAAMGQAAFEKVSALCLALPDTKLTMTWGSPHFRVAEKIFCGFGAEDGKQVMGVKLVMAHAKSIVKDSRFWPAPYVGKHGWVSMDVTRRKGWDEVAALIRESYELIAPKASRAKLR
jgi:predicted DNA-binding protein (MmcQ/YjbR family)